MAVAAVAGRKRGAGEAAITGNLAGGIGFRSRPANTEHVYGREIVLTSHVPRAAAGDSIRGPGAVIPGCRRSFIDIMPQYL